MTCTLAEDSTAGGEHLYSSRGLPFIRFSDQTWDVDRKDCILCMSPRGQEGSECCRVWTSVVFPGRGGAKVGRTFQCVPGRRCIGNLTASHGRPDAPLLQERNLSPHQDAGTAPALLSQQASPPPAPSPQGPRWMPMTAALLNSSQCLRFPPVKRRVTLVSYRFPKTRTPTEMNVTYSESKS